MVANMAVAGKPLTGARKLISERARELRLTLADLSRVAGKNESYMHQYMYRQSPRRLPEDVREAIARVLQVPDEALREGGSQSAGPVGPHIKPILTGSGGMDAGRDVPLFQEGDEIEPSLARDWTYRPVQLGAAAGPMTAIWIARPHDRLQPGDLAYLRTQPVRLGDLVAVTADRRLVGIGTLAALGDQVAQVGATRYHLDKHQLAKVVAALFA